MSNDTIVEAAHMELVEPSILTAFRRCTDQGATFIICYPFFLSRGKHVTTDIPYLVQEAANTVGVKYQITDHLGYDMDGIVNIMKETVEKTYP